MHLINEYSDPTVLDSGVEIVWEFYVIGIIRVITILICLD